MERFNFSGMRVLLVVSQLVWLIFTGCGEDFDRSAQYQKGYNPNTPDYHFIIYDPSVTGMVRHVKRDTINICTSGIGSGSWDKWEEWISGSVLKWIEPLRQLSSDELTRNINVTNDGQDCQAEFSVVSGEWGYTMMGNYPRVVVGPSVPYGVVIHEFGHVFALSDTYQGGISGNCQSGQPQSLMCNISFDGPQQDDANGISKIFKRVFPNDTPPPPVEEKPLEASVFLALEDVEGGNTQIYFSVLSKDEDSFGGDASYCIGGADSCQSDSGPWTSALEHNLEIDRPYSTRYQAQQSVQFQDGDKVLIRYRLDGEEKIQEFEVNSKGSEKLGML